MLEIRDIEGAERLAGVAYSAAEREQMLNNLEGQIAAAAARRQLKLENTAPPAMRFDPRLPGFQMPSARGGVRASVPPTKSIPADTTRTSPSPPSTSSRTGWRPARSLVVD